MFNFATFISHNLCRNADGSHLLEDRETSQYHNFVVNLQGSLLCSTSSPRRQTQRYLLKEASLQLPRPSCVTGDI